MWSMAIQPAAVNRSLASSPLTFPTQNLVSKKPFSNLIVAKSKASILKSGKVMISGLKANQRSVPISPAYSTAVVAEALAGETTEDQSSFSTPPEKEKLGVVVKPMERPRLVLKFIWLEKNIGIGLDQIIPGHGSIPLSPYYFWPRKDAWEELKNMLESKPWISQKQMIILLNQATDIINLWQQNGGD